MRPMHPLRFSGWRLLLVGLCVSCLAGGSLLASTIALVGGAALPGSFLLFPFAYALVLVAAEVYGTTVAGRLMWVAMLCLLIVGAAATIAGTLPVAPYWHTRQPDAFPAITGRAILGYGLGFLAGQQIAMRLSGRLVGEIGLPRRRWRRTLLGLTVAQVVGALIAVPLVYGQLLPAHILVSLLVARLAYAVLFSLAVAPAVYLASAAISVREDLATVRYARTHADVLTPEQEERQRVLADRISDGLATLDADSTIVYCNPAFGSLFGYSTAELTGQNIAVVQPERLRAAHRAAMARYATVVDEPINDGRLIQTTGLRRDGSEIGVAVTLLPYRQGARQYVAGLVSPLPPEAVQPLTDGLGDE